MTMKKLFYLAAFASVALVSCAENELAPQANQQKPISFSPVVTNNSRAQNEMGVTYNEETDFRVWSMYYADEYTTFGGGQAFMSFINASYDNSKDAYVPKDGSGKLFYWPKNGSLTFMAVSPAAAVSESTVAFTESGLTFTDYTVPNSGPQYDLLISERAYNKTQSDDAGVTNFDGVDIEFKHALSSIAFKAMTDVNYSSAGTTIRLKGITINQIGSVADFDQNLNDGDGYITNCPNRKSYDDEEEDDQFTPELEEGQILSTTAAAWSAPTVPLNYTVSGIPAVGVELSDSEHWTATGNTTAPDWDSDNLRKTDFILLPQSVAGKTITINYSIQHGAGVELNQTYEYTIPAGSKWLMGYRYIYTIEISLDPILLAPSVQVWERAEAPVTP